MDTDLPFIDEHEVLVNACAQTVWGALASQFSGLGKSAFTAYLGVISAEPRGSSGKPLDVGATVPGFRVTDSIPAGRVALTGRHRFSRYRLVFDLTAHDGKTVVRARTYASFPGLLGTAYQGLVIKSGAHRIITRRLLGAVRSRAERSAAEANP